MKISKRSFSIKMSFLQLKAKLVKPGDLLKFGTEALERVILTDKRHNFQLKCSIISVECNWVLVSQLHHAH